MRWWWLACVIAVAGCGATATAPDAGQRDSGPPDPCATDQAHVTSTVGCNGPPATAHAAPNEFGGECDVDPTELMTAGRALQGTCLHATDVCAGELGMRGICLRACDPAPTYVSTGTCPAGSRCFTINLAYGNVYCFPDCHTASDCAADACDDEGSCEFRGYMHDAGPPDSGIPDDAGAIDAATPIDAGISDAGVPTDASDGDG